MSVAVILSDRRFSLDGKRLKSLARRVLEGEGASTKSMNMVYCSDSFIRELNDRFKGRNHPTDVLAFEIPENGGSGFVGEIYVNLQQAKRQAHEYEVPYRQEVERLTVHGILHLLGYRDRNRRERKMMWTRQEGYL